MPSPTPSQVETALRSVNASFARLNGMSGAHMLDLYGRTAVVAAAAAPRPSQLSRKPSKRLPLSEATRALIRQAHSKLPREALGSLPGSAAASQPGSPALPLGLGGASLAPSRTPSLSFGQGGMLQPSALTGALSRQATVRFDVSADGQPAAGGSGPSRLQPPSRSASALGSRVAAAGVLHIPDEPDERADRLLPYRRLVIRTGSEPALAASPPPSGALPSGEIEPVVDAGSNAALAGVPPAAVPGPSGAGAVMRSGVSASGRDWGHITPSSE